ncbi:manganese efflux pump MntP family protein [uncultured Bacteroides sp.]|uniref:manganese efflux pump MntP n=1 Tax=uncultured Bacteroides sp. TaxID=162156 RepID=UPI0026307CCA|nr:manganese efflux pump MntP family protein [uncultured Bacteroides sp.]
MSTLEIWLLAISLAIDCFTVSVTSGIILRRIDWRTLLVMGFFFGLFQALMPLIGWFGASKFSHLIEAYDHWIAFGLLFFIGARMIREQFKEGETCCFNPTQLKVILTLAVATSIDALAVGISFAFTGFKVIQQLTWPLVIIGFVSFLLSGIGNLIGVFFGRRIHIRVEIFGGLVLIGIGIKILIEHLYLNN